MAKTPAKKLGKSAAIIHTKRVFGAERMAFPDVPLNDIEFLKCLSWYHNTKDVSLAKTYILEYLKSNNDERFEGVRKTPDKLIRPTAGWVARMKSLGLKTTVEQDTTFERILSDCARAKVDDPEEVPVPIAPVILKKAVVRSSDIIADIETALDQWRTQPFSVASYLTENKVSAAIVPSVLTYYAPLADEVQKAIAGKDKDLKEAYSHMSKIEINRYHRFLQAIIADLTKYVEVVTVPKERKPRKKKPISLDKKLSLLQYLPTFPPNQLKSIAPATMLGAKEVWLFEATSKRLIVLRADSPNGLDLNRTTLTGFDPKQSGAKRIGRGTGRILDSILMSPKTVCKKSYEAIKADALEATGRVNKNTIILKCFR